MTVLLTNNARSTLLSGINALQTEIRLRAGGGNTFPTITAPGQWFPITIEDSVGAIEIMRVIARSGDVFTVKRAQEGTTAKSFSANDVVELRLTVGAMQELVSDTHTNFGRIYTTPADGVDSKIGVPAGYYFNVRSPSDDSYVDEYQNVNGVAVATSKSYPSGALTQAMSEQIDKIGSLDYLSEQLDQIAVDKGWDASFVVYHGISQKKINDGLESIAEMLAIQNPFNGMRVYVKSYHDGLNKGGGTFVYNSAKALINDGVVCFNGWVRSSFMFITSSMAGCKIDGLTDDTPALQRAVDYTSSNGFTVLLDSGEHLLDDLKFHDPTNLYAQRGLNAFYFIKLKSGTHILGSKGSVIKVADGQLFKSFDYVGDIHTGTYLNWQMPGTKGFQVFAQVDVDEAIVDISLMNFTIDMNGYNNKIQPFNNFSNQSQCQAVYGLTGDNWLISEVKFKDASGSQVICLWQGVTNAKVRLNEFIDCGYLDGTNTHLDDHSTIYTMGAGTIVEQNKLTQSVQWAGKGGSPIETHGDGAIIRNNYIEKYASMGVCASAVTNSKINYVGNIGRSISAIGLDCYCLNGNTFDLTVRGNDVEIINTPLASDHPAVNHRSFIVTKYFDYNPGYASIVMIGNKVKAKNSSTLSTTEKEGNSIIHSRLVDKFEVLNNEFEGFAGAFVNLDIQKAGGSLLGQGNTLTSCGYSNEVKSKNSLINYINFNTSSYGIAINNINLISNVYKNCKYASYLGLSCVVLGYPIAPNIFNVINDVTDNWFTTTWSITDNVAPHGYNFRFEYTCTNAITGENLLKLLPITNTNLSKVQYGEIKIMAQVVQTFTKFNGVSGWMFNGLKFNSTPPAVGEGSPFGNNRGDRLEVMFTGFVGTPTAYVYTLLDGNGKYGWRPYGVIAS